MFTTKNLKKKNTYELFYRKFVFVNKQKYTSIFFQITKKNIGFYFYKSNNILVKEVDIDLWFVSIGWIIIDNGIPILSFS